MILLTSVTFRPNFDGATVDCKLEMNPFLMFKAHSGSDESLQTSVMVLLRNLKNADTGKQIRIFK